MGRRYEWEEGVGGGGGVRGGGGGSVYNIYIYPLIRRDLHQILTECRLSIVLNIRVESATRKRCCFFCLLFFVFLFFHNVLAFACNMLLFLFCFLENNAEGCHILQRCGKARIECVGERWRKGKGQVKVGGGGREQTKDVP